MAGALDNIKVLDLSRILAGPWAAQMLGDLGAVVLKVERPEKGDDTRYWGPPFVRNADGSQWDAAYFLCANRNKKNIQIDISTHEGQDQIRELVRECDILVENYKVGGLKKYGLDYDSLKKLNSGLIYCSITGFGQTGPYAQRPGYDFLIQAMSGMMSITGESEDTEGSSPQKVGVAVADIMTGMYATIGILAALNHKRNTGEGQYIDLALMDCQLAMLANQNMNYLVGGIVPERIGNAHPNIVPYQVFETHDGFVILAVGNDLQFEKFCRLNGENWYQDERFSSNPARVENRIFLVPMIEVIMKKRTTKSWIKLLEKNNVPCGPVNTIKQAFDDPQVIHREMKREMKRDDGSIVPTVSNPIKLSKTPIRYDIAAPILNKGTYQDKQV